MPESGFSSLRGELKKNQYLREKIEKKEGRWPVSESSIEDFEQDFQQLLETDQEEGRMGIRFLVRERQRQDHKPIVLDLMGDGEAMRGIANTRFIQRKGMHGLSVTLNDLRDADAMQADQKQDLDVLEENLLTGKGWRAIRHWLVEIDEQAKFDVILSRARGGLHAIGESPRTAFSLLNRAYRLLEKGGVMILEIPELPRVEVETFCLDMNKIPGIKMRLDYNYRGFPTKIRIDKGEEAPDDLRSIIAEHK